MSNEQTLFGAVTTTIPTRFRDASYTRRVPYNQEVFVDSMRDESLVFEVNELNDKVSDENSAIHFLKELGQKLYSGSSSTNDIHIERFQNCVLKNQIPDVVVTTAVGTVDISKRRQGKGVQNRIKIYLANIRLKDPKYKTDVLITAYKTLYPNQQSGNQVEEIDQIFKEAVCNFKVTDWSFFSDEP